MKKIILYCGLILLALLLSFYAVNSYIYHQKQAPVFDGDEDIGNHNGEPQLEFQNSESDLIQVESPMPNASVSNPVTVSGVARGMWFFEASFPLVVVDWDGKIIGEGYATADGDWMTEDFVPFTGKVSYTLPDDVPYRRGAIIFRKDNPSGLPEHDDAIEIPVVFK